jgi:hypothetical protein
VFCSLFLGPVRPQSHNVAGVRVRRSRRILLEGMIQGRISRQEANTSCQLKSGILNVLRNRGTQQTLFGWFFDHFHLTTDELCWSHGHWKNLVSLDARQLSLTAVFHSWSPFTNPSFLDVDSASQTHLNYSICASVPQTITIHKL